VPALVGTESAVQYRMLPVGSGFTWTLSTSTGGTSIVPPSAGSTYTSTYSSTVAWSPIGSRCWVSSRHAFPHQSHAVQVGSVPDSDVCSSIQTWSPFLIG